MRPLALALLSACACTPTGDSDPHSDTDPPRRWVNPDWDPDKCDRSGSLEEWVEKHAYLLPYNDGLHRLEVAHFELASYETDLSMSWYMERGASLEPGAVALSERSNHVDPAYAMIAMWCGGSCDRRFHAISGRAVIESTVEPNGEDFHGYLDQVIFQEGSFNLQTQESEVFPDGEVWCLEHYRLDAPLSTQPPRDR
jgi:hypothetical protein